MINFEKYNKPMTYVDIAGKFLKYNFVYAPLAITYFHIFAGFDKEINVLRIK